MWEKLKNAAQHPAVQFVKKICGDPVQLYVVLLMTAIMQYYHSSMNWLYTLLSVFISYGLMKLFDFIAKHKIAGPICYLVLLFVGMLGAMLLTQIGYQDYPITFFVWFLTPQSVVSFSIWYTIAIYALMLGFLSSTVYYFSKVRYRMVMQFLIMLIPLSLYAKEGIQMPALLVILLLSSYYLLMIYCRQLKESTEVRRERSFQGSVSVTVFVLAFSILAAVVPKPKFQADREYIENALAYSSLSDSLMEAISMFMDTTDNSAMMSTNARTIYYVNSMEPLRLRTQTFTYYQADDSWSKTNYYDYPAYDYTGVVFYQPRMMLQALLDAAEADAEFAQTYGLTELAETELPEQKARYLMVMTNLRGTNMLPTPTRLGELYGSRTSDTMVSEHGALTPKTQTYSYRDVFEMAYYSDIYARETEVTALLQQLQKETYGELLQDAAEVLADDDPALSEYLKICEEERTEAFDFLEACENLDYQSDVIDSLAQELTAGLTSDYEKAKAIEQYFTETGFVYDLTYQKENGDNIDTFLTESRRGVCYEFATAMVLLCRSAGLPARYVQGYSVNERYYAEFNGYETNYLIKVRDAHAYPEVYISGYGWLGFEPTVAAQDEYGDGTAENQIVMLWGLVLLGLCMIALVIYFLLPVIRERQFRRKIAGMTPQDAAAAAFRRMRCTLHLPDSITVMELADASEVFVKNKIDAAEFYAQLDVLMYGRDAAKPGMTTEQLLNAYIQWHTDRKEYLKAEKQKARKRKR